VPKKGCLGCSFPVLIGIIIIVIALVVVGLLSGAMGKALVGETGLGELFAIEKPHIQLPSEPLVHVFSVGNQDFNITNTLLASWLSIIVLIGIAYAVTRRIKLIPSRLQSLVESAIEWMLNLCVDVAGEKNGRRFFPLVTTIFLFVLMNAWMNLIPGYGSILVHTHGHEVHLLRGANTDINTPLAIALIAFIFIESNGIRALGGLRYFRKFFNVGRFFNGVGQLFRGKLRAGFAGIGMGGIDIFSGALEGMSEIFRIVSFTFRLFGNMTGGEILILMMMFLVPWVVAIPFYGLELLIGLVQAIIFAGLTLVFATVAVTPHEGNEH